jgi:hypothetical protein
VYKLKLVYNWLDLARKIRHLDVIGAYKNRSKERKRRKKQNMNSRKPFKRKPQIEQVNARLEIENNIVNLQCQKFELREAKKELKLQRAIHQKQGWRDYTR